MDTSSSGRDHLLRASTYFRTSEYYTSGDPIGIGDAGRECFARAAALRDPPIEVVRIPYGDGELPGYFVGPATGGAAPRGPARPTLVGIGGFDSSAEELYFHYGAPGAERGWNVLVFDGPGQPGCMRDNPTLTFRADYEVPVAAVLDAVSARPDVDAGRLALAGQSFGGYFAARSAASDDRVRALVTNPPVVDMSRFMEAWIGSEVFRMSRDIRPADVTGVPEDLMPAQMQWGIEAICRRFGVRSFHEWRDVIATYRLGELLGAIGCPVLALVGESEGPEPLAQFDEFVAGRRRTGHRTSVQRRPGGVGPLSGRQYPAVGAGDVRLARRTVRLTVRHHLPGPLRRSVGGPPGAVAGGVPAVMLVPVVGSDLRRHRTRVPWGDPRGRGDEMSENLRLLGKYSEAMESGDGEAVYEFFSDDFHSHVTDRVAPERAGTDLRGEEQLWWSQARSAFPDMEFTVDLLIESEDLVVSNWTVTGTHTGTPFYDVPASGRPVTINGTAILRIRDGRIVEHWGGPHCQKGLGLII